MHFQTASLHSYKQQPGSAHACPKGESSKGDVPSSGKSCLALHSQALALTVGQATFLRGWHALWRVRSLSLCRRAKFLRHQRTLCEDRACRSALAVAPWALPSVSDRSRHVAVQNVGFVGYGRRLAGSCYVAALLCAATPCKALL